MPRWIAMRAGSASLILHPRRERASSDGRFRTFSSLRSGGRWTRRRPGATVCWDDDVNQPPDEPRPDFEPPAPLESRSAVEEGVPAPARRVGASRFLGRAVTLIVLLAVAVCVYLVNRGQDDPILGGRSGSVGAVPPSLTHPLPTQGHRPGDLLLQQRWGPADGVYPMDLSGLTFSFRAPGSWGCLASSQAGVRWICMDETGRINGTRPARPSGGIIQSDECKAPCASKDYADVNRRLHALGIDTAGLHVVDGRTRVDDRADPADPALREYRMSRTFDSDGDGTLDRHLWVQIDVNATDRISVQKLLGDLYDATR
jgi:hypothetical protein